jgi:hypothetical protein
MVSVGMVKLCTVKQGYSVMSIAMLYALSGIPGNYPTASGGPMDPYLSYTIGFVSYIHGCESRDACLP